MSNTNNEPKDTYMVFNVYQTNGLTNQANLAKIVETAIENGAHLLQKGDSHALFGFAGELKDFRKATGRTKDAYIVTDAQPYVHPTEYGGSG